MKQLMMEMEVGETSHSQWTQGEASIVVPV